MELPSVVTSTLAVVLLFFGPFFLLIGAMVPIMKRYKRSHASPLTRDLLRPAGHSLQEQIDDKKIELFGTMVVTPLMLLMFALMPLLQNSLDDTRISTNQLVMFGVMAAGTLSYFSYRIYKIVRHLQHLTLGYACELAVGQELEYLVRPKDHPYRVYHDIPFDGFNIDHLIISPNGVFVVETKGRSKPINDGTKQFKVRVENNALHFPNHVETEPLEQVRRNVTSVRNWLNSATGTDVPVGGILVLPGWYIELCQKATAPYVVSAAALPKVLPQLRVGMLELAHIQAIAHQVEQKVRDIAK
ncbi:nuclease-related domain-containing protein [Aeromonas sp. MR16]|uniref:nuclease-related domain-containing protein n=1 Tax=Aeromonas sp. MR16 TaxID=2923420 RepID=UPI001F4B43BB|nr:nuclease-related domain-containing protein [Aeromonas sp. MR16]MCH7369717.1 NERD domain-containing protein [Aeromonas sp. MR16]